MKLLTLLLVATLATTLLAGCKGGGGGSGLGSLFDPIVNSGSSGTSSGLVSTSPVSGSSGSIGTLAHTPEPNTLALLGIGLAGLVAAALRKKKKS